jgi:hypothetical protein
MEVSPRNVLPHESSLQRLILRGQSRGGSKRIPKCQGVDEVTRRRFGKREMVSPKAVSAPSEVVPIDDVVFWSVFEPELSEQRHALKRRFEVGYGNEHIEDRLGCQTGDRSAANVMHGFDAMLEMTDKATSQFLEHAGPAVVVLHEPKLAFDHPQRF